MKNSTFWFLVPAILFSNFCFAQLLPASPPIADSSDTRFSNVKEDWSSPALTRTRLEPAVPLVAQLQDKPTYTVELVRVQWRFGDPVELYVMKPKGIKKPPVILYLYGYPAGTDRFKDENFQDFVTKDGFAAVGFVSALTGPRYHDRPMREWFVSELPQSLAASAHDVQMILDYLSTRGDLDMSRTGMFAQGSGASIAILASAVESRITVLDALDPWGDWPEWMRKSPFIPEEERAQYVKPEFLRSTATLDPVDWLPRIQARKFRLQDAVFEPSTPPLAKEKLRSALSSNASLKIYSTLDEFNEVVRNHEELDWIYHALRSLPPRP